MNTRIFRDNQVNLGTQGDLIIHDAGGEQILLPIGTPGQVLKVNIGGTAPVWDVDDVGPLSWLVIGFTPDCDFTCTNVNDEAQILAAVTYGMANNRRRLYFRSGDYLLDVLPLTLPKDMSMYWEGERWETGSATLYGGVRIKANTTGTNMIEFKGNNVPTAYSDLTKGWDSMFIAYDGDGQVDHTIYLLNADRISFTICRLIGGQKHSLFQDYDGADPIGSTSYEPGGLRLNRCNLGAVGDGTVGNHTSVMKIKFQTQDWISDCWFATSTGVDHMIVYDRADKVKVSNTEFNNAGVSLFHLQDSATFSTNDIEHKGCIYEPGNGKKFWTVNLVNASSRKIDIKNGNTFGFTGLATPYDDLPYAEGQFGGVGFPFKNTESNKIVKVNNGRTDYAHSVVTIRDDGYLSHILAARIDNTDTVNNYPSLEIYTDSTNHGIYMEQNGTLSSGFRTAYINVVTDLGATNTQGLFVRSQFANTGGDNSSVVKFINESATSTNRTLDIVNNGNNASIFVTQTGQLANNKRAVDVRVNSVLANSGSHGMLIFSSAIHTLSTSGLLRIDNSGATANNRALDIKDAGTGTSVNIQKTNVAGTAVKIDGDALTTGTAFNTALAGLTTGSGWVLFSSSADVSARNLAIITNDDALAVGAIPLKIVNKAKVTTNFVKLQQYSNGTLTITLWMSDTTDPNGNLSGSVGDICYNGVAGQPSYCTGTTNWTGM